MVSFATVLLVASEVAEEGTKKANNPILPVSNELFWAAVTFGLLWILMKFVLLPPVVKGMENREAKVRGDLDAAESAQTEATTKLAEYQASLVSTKADAVRRIEDARVEAEAARRQVIQAAESDAFKCGSHGGVVTFVRWIGITGGRAQRAQRQIRILRHEHHLIAWWQQDTPMPPGPQP